MVDGYLLWYIGGAPNSKPTRQAKSSGKEQESASRGFVVESMESVAENDAGMLVPLRVDVIGYVLLQSCKSN